MIIWPQNLPQEFLQNGYGENPVDLSIRDDSDDGNFFQAPIYTGRRTKIAGNMHMDGDQWDTLMDFFYNTLANGTQKFEGDRYDGTRTYQFDSSKPPTRSDNRGVYWTVKMEMFVYA